MSRSRRRVLVALIAAAASAPAHAQTCTPFTDVAASDPFCANIQWMFNRGITLGCTSTTYCPTQFVRRDQMAAFMNRLGNVTFQQGGNAFGAAAVLGTTDDQPLNIVVNNAPAMRFLPPSSSPVLIGGAAGNTVTGAFSGGGVIAGGGGEGTCTANGRPGRSCLNAIDDGPFSVVGGGISNVAGNSYTIVAGGFGNTANGLFATVSGGVGNVASGFYSTIPGGNLNDAIGNYSFAAGRRARATTQGSFIWADSRDFDFQPSVGNFFGVRATGGVGLTVAIDPANGAVSQFCNLLPGVAAWQCTSDRDAKENFAAVDARAILERLATMPITTWNFKGADPSIRNLGPTAQDFQAAFGLSTDDKSIAGGNLHGVALAAIKGLNVKLEAAIGIRDATIAEQGRALEAQRREIDAQRRELAALRDELRVLMTRLGPGSLAAR